MTQLEKLKAYKVSLINEINAYKDQMINWGFDWPMEILNPETPEAYSENELSDFYSEIMGFKALREFELNNYPYTR